jgi:tetratricopeptide (TPR) repeat protein
MADTVKNPAIVFDLKPTLYGKGIRVQDIMILNIIQANSFRKPIYFALTVSQENLINLTDYLRMDGLVYKLVTYKGQKLSPVHLKNNLLNKFQYRNLNNPEVYFNENIKGLLRNYHGSFYHLCRFYATEKMYDDLKEVMDFMFTVMPDTVIPMRHELQFQFALLYREAKAQDKAEEIFKRIMARADVNIDSKLQYAYYFYRNDNEKALAYIKQIHEENPDYANATYWLATQYLQNDKYQEGLDLITEWMKTHPNDQTAQALKRQIESQMKKTIPDTMPSN